MSDRLLICTDLDRTLIPNGAQPESPQARPLFEKLVTCPWVTLAYVSGRHRALVQQAMDEFQLPVPDFVIGDVGTTIYHVGVGESWQSQDYWEHEIAQDWGGYDHAGIENLLHGLPDLQLQESAKQNHYKLSYYVPLGCDREALFAVINHRLGMHQVKANLIWSVDEQQEIGLLDILPQRASKYHAVESLMRLNGFDYGNTVFCGDSGNDIEVLASPIPAVLVANAQQDVKELARQLATETGFAEQLYIASGGFLGMNGNYCAGMLEGIAHYHPAITKYYADEVQME